MTAINARSRSWEIVASGCSWSASLSFAVRLLLLLGDNACQELLGLVCGEHRRFALLDDVLGAAYRAGRVEIHDAAAGQPVEAHADGGEVLLDGRCRSVFGQRFDVGGDMHWLDAGERQAVPLAPGEEIADGSSICLPRIGVADGGGQEFDEPLACLLPGVGDDGGYDDAAVRYQPVNFRWL